MSPMRCPSCGTMYDPTAKFCTRDGTRLVPAVAPARAPWDPPVEGGRSTAVRTPTPPSPQLAVGHSQLVGQVLDRRYQIERKLGEGGMAVVYLARDVATGARYAIKVLSPALARDATAMARLRREAALGLRLEHPNVCHIIRLGEIEGGVAYIVMPYVEGEVLAERTYRRGQLTLEETVAIVRDIAAGLALAHSLQIVHRDLKPENVMIARDAEGRERAVVMDFGLAKERRAGSDLEKLTKTGIVLGTPEFMSPEQLRGKPLDARSDVYALALMAFEMLTGQLPFTGTTQQEIMIARLRGDPTPLRKARPDLAFPPGVERVLLKGMARDADDRYATAPELAEALARAAAGEEERRSGGLGRFFGR